MEHVELSQIAGTTMPKLGKVTTTNGASIHVRPQNGFRGQRLRARLLLSSGEEHFAGPLHVTEGDFINEKKLILAWMAACGRGPEEIRGRAHDRNAVYFFLDSEGLINLYFADYAPRVKPPSVASQARREGVPGATGSRDEDLDEKYREGRELSRLHRQKDRNRKAVQRKKQQVLARNNKLLCEVCDFDFAEYYGPLGEGFAECHHRTPLAKLTEEHHVRLSELAIVWANCHRMLHREPFYAVEALREIVRSRKGLE